MVKGNGKNREKNVEKLQKNGKKRRKTSKTGEKQQIN